MMKPDLLNDKEVMIKVYAEYPKKAAYPNNPKNCNHNARWQVIYCKGDWDIERCNLCGKEIVTSCSFDSDYD